MHVKHVRLSVISTVTEKMAKKLVADRDLSLILSKDLFQKLTLQFSCLKFCQKWNENKSTLKKRI